MKHPSKAVEWSATAAPGAKLFPRSTCCAHRKCGQHQDLSFKLDIRYAGGKDVRRSLQERSSSEVARIAKTERCPLLPLKAGSTRLVGWMAWRRPHGTLTNVGTCDHFFSTRLLLEKPTRSSSSTLRWADVREVQVHGRRFEVLIRDGPR